MPSSKDLFDDSTMSFGDHLEVLRVHLWKALIGLLLGVILALFFGDKIVAIIRSPIDSALRDHGMESEDNIKGFDFAAYLKSMITGVTPFEGTEVTDAGLQHLEALANLEKIDLSDTQVTSSGLKKLKSTFPELQTSIDPLSVSELNSLMEFTVQGELNENYDLVSLDLSGSEIADENLAEVKGQRALEILNLSRTNIGDEGLSYISDLENLKSLNLSRTKISDNSLIVISELKNLEELRLRNTKVSDTGLKSLAKLTALRNLDLSLTEVTDIGLESIAELKNLDTLSLNGKKITDKGLNIVGSLTNLQTLNLTGTGITDEGLKSLQGLDQLKELNFVSDSSRLNKDRNKVVASGRDSIVVKVDGRKLASQLSHLKSGTLPQADGSDELVLSLTLTAPEFAQFRHTSEKMDKPITLNVQEAFLTYLKVAFVSGLVFSSPWVFFQIWQFVAAGLYPHEQRYVYMYLPLSLTLFIGGAAFCFTMVFPFVLDFLLGFNKWLGVIPQIRLSEWISFAIMLPLMFGVSFQLPLVMLFLERISIFEAADYRDKRRMAILVIAILSMLLTPADPMSMMMMMIPLLFLYEMGIFFCTLSAKKSPFEDEAT